MKRNKKIEGISLIVLVISIIIMIVLATTMVLSITNSGILEQSNVAVNENHVANAKEVLNAAYSNWLLTHRQENVKITEAEIVGLVEEKQLPIGYAVGAKNGKAEISKKTWETGWTEPATVNRAVDGTINYSSSNPVIPAGFVPVNNTATALVKTVDTSIADAVWGSANGWNEGLVIQDKNGNQFVWVPVSDINLFYEISSELLYTIELDGKTVEGVLDEDIAEFNAMRTSVEAYEGFYIARFEVGDATATANNYTGRTNSTGIANAWTIKSSQIPYNYIGYGQSKTMAKGMYNSSEYGSKSTLTFGTQWEYTLQWLKNFDDNVDLNNDTWGNSYTNTSVLTNEVVYGATNAIPTNGTTIGTLNNVALTSFSALETGSNKRSDVVTLLTTGASQDYMKKNIYDFVGNLSEFVMTGKLTQEIQKWIYGCKAGGCCYNLQGIHVVTGGGSIPEDINTAIIQSTTGFRPTMYIL